MKLLNFFDENTARLGLKTAQGIVNVAAAKTGLGPAVADAPTTMSALLAGGQAALAQLSILANLAMESDATAGWLLDEAGLRLGPAAPNPGKIICIGLNYRRHAAESRKAVPETPLLFSKFNNSIAAPGEVIPLPDNAKKYDHEVELAVVIGRQARYVAEADALAYVLGYCTANDVSARDLQGRTSQWLLGKTLDKFFPIGPYLVTADEIDDPQSLALKCWVNGVLHQNSTTADMIFSVAHLISYASQYMTLEPGDVISTGTPEGVIMGMAERVWLKPGDEVTVEVEGLGKLTNSMGRDAA